MPKQNRGTPIIAASTRGDLMGNRGILHNDPQQIVRPYKNKAWIICLLDFKERRRTVMSPGKYTELFFLDEAIALARRASAMFGMPAGTGTGIPNCLDGCQPRWD